MVYSDVQFVYPGTKISPSANDSSNICFWILPLDALPGETWKAPTAAAINAGLNATDAIRIDGFDFAPEASEDVDDRSFGDNAASTYNGFEQFGGNVVAYNPRPGDTTSVAAQTKQVLGAYREEFWWVERIADGKTKLDPAAPGDYISVYRVLTGSRSYDTSDRNLGITYSSNLLAQGDVAINTMVKATGTPTYAPTTLTGTVGGIGFATATLSSRDVTRGGEWVSSNPLVAEVTPNGVVKYVGTGTATVTKVIDAATAPGTGVAVTVS